MVATPDGAWHRDSHCWKKFIGGGTQHTDFNKGTIGRMFAMFSRFCAGFCLVFLAFVDKGVGVVATPDRVWHRDSHYWRKLIGSGYTR